MIKIYFSVYFSLDIKSCYLKTANFARLDFILVLRPKLVKNANIVCGWS